MTTNDPGGALAAGWMPLRLVAVSPLAGHNKERPEGLLRITKENLDAVMENVAPSLTLKVANPADGDKPVEVTIRFRSLADFSPVRWIAAIPALAELAKDRANDAVVTRFLDAILHHPAFLELEAAWRGLRYLADRGEAGEGTLTPLVLEALALHAGEDETDRFRTVVFDPDYEDRADVPMAAVIADRVYEHTPASLAKLTHYAGLANALQSPYIAGVGAAMFGMKNLAHLPNLADLVTRTTGGPWTNWNAFQKENTSRWICLTVNRFLLRAPHGEGAAEGADYVYRETVDPAHPEWLCWGNAVWAVGASMARSFAEHGHCAAADGLSGTGGHHGLPTRELKESPTKSVRMSTEILISDEKAWELCRAGFTPLIGMADGDIAYFPFLGNAYRARLGSLTIDQALTYQLYAGQLSHLVLKLAATQPAGSPEEVCGWFQQQIFTHLSPFVGDAPGTHVQVTPAATEGGGAAAAIKVTPTFKIQDKKFDLELGVGLR